MPVVEGRIPVMQTAPRRIAERRLAMGVAEQGAAPREPVDVGRPRLRMTAEAADPVVQVVDGDEEDVGLAPGGRGWTAKDREE